MMRHVSKAEMRKLIAMMESGAYAERGWKTRIEKNGRGDYGYTEVFSFGGRDVLQISIDGARTDTQFAFDLEALKLARKAETAGGASWLAKTASSGT
jgi:hypothetical protein